VLFLPDSIYQARRRTVEAIETGKLTKREGYEALLALDPGDHISLQGLARLCNDLGDLSAAEEHLWRAIRAQPLYWPSYMELARLLQSQPARGALSEGLAQLALRKLSEDEEAAKKFGDSPALARFQESGALANWDTAERLALLAEACKRLQDTEPAEVSSALRPYRLIDSLQATMDLDAALVDSILAEGKAIAPLLVGVLRGWATQFIADEDAHIVENALALLGETGDSADLPHLVEFLGRDPVDLSRAAAWAVGRIMDRDTENARTRIIALLPGLEAPPRLALAELLVERPDFDPSEEVYQSLFQNLGTVSRQLLNSTFLPMLITVAAGLGARGNALGRRALEDNRRLLSRNLFRDCRDLLEAAGELNLDPPAPTPGYTIYDICSGNAVWETGDREEELEPQDEAPAERVHQHARPGRNDPCWCGSGKKYKKCHLESDEHGKRLSSPGLPDPLDPLRRRIGKFLQEVVSAKERDAAALAFFEGVEREDQDELVLADWLVHDWVSPSLGRKVLEEFFLRHGSSLSPRERDFVASSLASSHRLYEVQAVSPEKGVEVRDLISRTVSFVHDISLSRVLVKWDGLLARVIQGTRGLEFSGAGTRIPRNQLNSLLDWLKQDRLQSGLPWNEYYKRNVSRIRNRSEEMGREFLGNLRVQNSHGEDLRFTKSVYQIEDPQAVAEALRNCPEMAEDADNARFTWLSGKAGGENGGTVLGTIQIRGGELTLDCNSTQRTGRGKTLLATLAGSGLRHLRDETVTLAEMKRRAAASGGDSAAASGREEIPPEVQHQILTKFYEQHYSTWPDTPLTGLGGLTPRQSMRTARGRAQVSEILRDIENGEERKRRNGEPFYDVSRLRAALGLVE
jgi:tetratricopeptide (TPR) repeat protein